MLRETFAVGPLGCNCTLLVDDATKETLVVDPGGDADLILSRLNAHGSKVKAIIITHAHIDHLGAIPEVQAATGAPVWLNEHDRALYQAVDIQATLLRIRAPKLPEFEARLVDNFSIGFGQSESGVLHTPGHTPGSVCFHLPEHKIMIAGDTLFAGSIGRTDLWGGDHATILRSLHDRILRADDDTTVICGHGPDTTIARERRTNPFLQ
jgi:hydroxyacylglutathione hydrolase